MTHDLSLGELQSLALKAARGTGRPHGLAEEAAFGVRWLTERGHDGAGALAALLSETDGRPEGCSIGLGTALSDAGAVPEGPLGPVYSPMMLLPFLAPLCAKDAGLSVTAGDARLALSREGGIEGRALPLGLTQVHVEPCAPPEAGPLHSRARVEDATLQVLTAFAFRTYAPATDESRAKGAGAGVSDND
ncbi:DUF3726 domain-containing protein [Gymnodinialimonas ulvae]|uniref:DUF3726 domain-containing protein n=1 Tax=Gymnodinialimonas ulvae TaxID=3126504 RepID=UPI003099CFD5